MVVIGGGPAGMHGALQAGRAGRRVLLVDRERRAGGECVYRGTIPSKTLRETAVYLGRLGRRLPALAGTTATAEIDVSRVTARLDGVLAAHHDFLARQLEQGGVVRRQGRARFLGPHELEIRAPGGESGRVRFDHALIATGSRPREPRETPIDHEYVLDSDSILRLPFLPRSLVVLGGGVIASEFASIFAALGSQVTLVDRGQRPLGFMDPELTDRFLASFSRAGGAFVAGATARGVTVEPLSGARVELSNGELLEADKVLVALGRVASLDGLGLDSLGLAPGPRGHLPVDAHGRTAVPHVYAAGDVVGPPALAATSMEQGRRAMCHALGLPAGAGSATVPVGIYTIPEMASVGLTEQEARERRGAVLVGRAEHAELARAHIDDDTEGLLKLVADESGTQLLGAHAIGEGATELVHLAQLAMLGGLGVDTFVENAMNFPTRAEAYRIAALQIIEQRRDRAREASRSRRPPRPSAAPVLLA